MNTVSNVGDKLLLSTSTAVLVITVIVVIVGALAIILLHQNQEINKLKEDAKPRYGFLGKPLLSVLVAALLVGTFGLTYLARQGGNSISVTEETKVELTISTVPLEFVDDGTVNVRFSVVPKVNEVEWNFKPGETAFAYWNIVGPQKYSEFEVNLNSNKLGGFVKNIPRGEYKITVNLVLSGNTYVKTITTTF